MSLSLSLSVRVRAHVFVLFFVGISVVEESCFNKLKSSSTGSASTRRKSS